MAKELDQLTMDSIAAQKAGMSYGKWKALQPIVKVDLPETAPKRLCKLCGGEIPPEFHKNRTYCSDQCFDEADRIRHRNNYHKRKERMMANG